MKAGFVYAVTFVGLVLQGCSDDKPSGAYKKFLEEKIVCPSPADAEFQAWGKSGTQHICKINHGPVVMWENGYVNARGQYENGKYAGAWLWYHKNGQIYLRGQYSHGKEIGTWTWYDETGKVVKQENR